MTTYTAIPNSELAVDAPARSINALQLRDNPIAITEGATGAPRIVFGAMIAPTAGSVTVWRHRLDGDDAFGTASATFFPTQFQAPPIRNAGTVRMSLDLKSSAGGQLVFSRFLKNGAVLQTDNNSTTTYVTKTLDVAVVDGDVLFFEFASDDATGFPIVRQTRLLSADNTIVTYAEGFFFA